MSDWTTQGADTVEQLVTTVRDKTVVPATNATKAVVYGLLVLFFGLTALTLFCIMVFRILNVYVPGGVWVSWLILGGIFVLAGGFCWTKRS